MVPPSRSSQPVDVDANHLFETFLVVSEFPAEQLGATSQNLEIPASLNKFLLEKGQAGLGIVVRLLGNAAVAQRRSHLLVHRALVLEHGAERRGRPDGLGELALEAG